MVARSLETETIHHYNTHYHDQTLKFYVTQKNNCGFIL